MTIRDSHYFADHFPGIEKQFAFPLVLHVTGDIDAREGVASDGVVIGKFLAANYVQSAVEYDDSASAGSQYSDVTADLNASGTEELFNTDEVDDAIYIGDSNRFGGMLVDMATAGDNSGAVTWEYLNSAGTWVNLATAHELIDDSASFTTGTAAYVVSFKVPDDWVTGSIGDAGLTVSGLYWVRARVTTATYTIEPVLTSISVYSGIDASGMRMPFNGYLERVTFTADVEADDDDLELNIWNTTRGTFGTVTLDDDLRVGSAELAFPGNGLYFLKGDELLIQATSTASAEMAGVNLVLEFRV